MVGLLLVCLCFVGVDDNLQIFCGASFFPCDCRIRSNTFAITGGQSCTTKICKLSTSTFVCLLVLSP